MKKIKREWPFYAFYDHTGMARHLERMAAKGWMLDHITTNGAWRYHAIEPARVHFAVTYFPYASDFDAAPDDDLQEFLDLCEAAGWELVTRTFQLLVFCNRAEDPVPLDTDPAIQVRNIHESMWSSYMWGKVIGLGLGCFLLLKALNDFYNSPFSFLSQYISLLLLGLGAVLALHEGLELAAYYLWHRRATRVAEEEGRFLPTPSRWWREALYGALFAALLLAYAILGSWRISLACSLFALAVELCRRVSYLLRDALKRFRLPRHFNRIVTFIALWVMILGAQYVRNSSMDLVIGSSHATAEYTYQDRTYTAYCDDLPLTVGDLLGADDARYSNRLYSQGTFLASKLSGYQTLRNGYDREENQPKSFYYHVYWSHLDNALDDAAQWRTYYNLYFFDTLDPKDSHAIDPTPYGAAAAWKNNSSYLLRYEDCVIQLSFGWYPTDAQLSQCIAVLRSL